MLQIGDIVGRLTIIDKFQVPNKNSSHLKFLCKCECGNEKWVRYCNLQTKNTLSCGCLRREPRYHKRIGAAEAVRSKFNYYLRNAKTRGYVWTLTFEEFEELIHKPCTFCQHPGRTMLKSRTFNTSFYKVNGIDRIDNSLGYLPENSVACCEICNRAKGTLSYDAFTTWIRELYAHTFHK